MGYILRTLFVCLLCHGVAAFEEALTTVVPAGRVLCFFQNVAHRNYSSFIIDYQVVYGGDLDINVLVLNPGGDTVVNEERRNDGSHEIQPVQLGDYQICFDNSFSYQTEKTIFFRVELYREDGGSSSELEYETQKMQEEALSHLKFYSESFKERLQSIRHRLSLAERFQASRKAHEMRDRLLMNQKLERVNFWSIVNLSMLLLVASLQVYIIRSFFRENVKNGRNLRQRT